MPKDKKSKKSRLRDMIKLNPKGLLKNVGSRQKALDKAASTPKSKKKHAALKGAKFE